MSERGSGEERNCPECHHRSPPGGNDVHPNCSARLERTIDFRNSDERLKREVPRRIEERRRDGLEGLVGGLEFVVINTEREHQRAAVEELVARTGLSVVDAFEGAAMRTVVLRVAGSADVLVTSRVGGSPFASFADQSQSRRLPATRVETFAFSCRDLDAYQRIQRERGVRFMTPTPVEAPSFRWLQAEPSRFTGNSIGLIERRDPTRSYRGEGARDLGWRFETPKPEYLATVGRLDHAATRVRAADRDDAILEFIALTNYAFDFAIYVKSLNSITNVARLSVDDFAMVFTSGIAPFCNESTSGPTERFIHSFGPRVHHLAWDTGSIEETFGRLQADGQEFLLDLVGSPQEGLKQTFTTMSPHTLLVNEYIHRYGGFDGFFTRSNVTLLTKATATQ
jgi:4-hydroxyphenylpyruvate dioxygenase-like putative hemolysin